MAKMTKAQAKRALNAIKSKAFKIWLAYPAVLKISDIQEIEKVCDRALKRL